MSDSSTQARTPRTELEVPGYGLPMRHMPRDVFVHGKRVRYPNAVSDFHAYLLSQHELEMLRLMNKVTEKDSWDIRIFDPQTVERWRLELLRSTWTPDGLRVSERGFNHVSPPGSLKALVRAKEVLSVLRSFEIRLRTWTKHSALWSLTHQTLPSSNLTAQSARRIEKT